MLSLKEQKRMERSERKRTPCPTLEKTDSLGYHTLVRGVNFFILELSSLKVEYESIIVFVTLSLKGLCKSFKK